MAISNAGDGHSDFGTVRNSHPIPGNSLTAGLEKLRAAELAGRDKIESAMTPGSRASYPDNRRGPRTP